MERVTKENMKIDVNFSLFCDRFVMLDRDSQFSYKGKRALYDYLTDLEQDTGEEIELDVIALCCEYTEYESLEEVKANYSDIKSLEDLNDHTSVIELENGGLIIQNY